jgi:hypothetical protein
MEGPKPLVAPKAAQNEQNKANPENRNRRYLAAGKGIWLNFLLDSEPVI